MKEAAEAYRCGARMWEDGDALERLLSGAGVSRVAVPFLPKGWTRDALLPELGPLIEAGDAIELLDDLNRATWPFAKAGFFGVKKKIEGVLGEIGITGSALDAAE